MSNTDPFAVYIIYTKGGEKILGGKFKEREDAQKYADNYNLMIAWKCKAVVRDTRLHK